MAWKKNLPEMRICVCVFALMFVACFVAQGAIIVKGIRPNKRPASHPAVEVHIHEQAERLETPLPQRHVGNVPVPQLGRGLPIAAPEMQEYLRDRLCVTGGITENGVVQTCTTENER